MEGETHAHLKKLALHFLKSKVTDLVCNEVDFDNAWSICDAVGLNFKRKEVRVIEVKASKGDYKRDTKLFGNKTSYFYHAHYTYIMCPTDLIQPDELPHGYGLLWVDEHDKIEVVKKPIKNTARLKTLFDTTLKRACRTLTNQMLFKEENRDNRDETAGKFSRNAIVKLISVRCPTCRKATKELINKDFTGTIKCSQKGCIGEIDLSKAKIREVTGFNNAFINKINKLKGTDE